MVPLTALFFIPWLLTGISCSVFTNPGPAVKDDTAPKPVYRVGSTIDITWTPPDEANKGMSVVLYQLNKTTGQFFDDMEYLTQNAVGVTKYTWLVGTRKDLTISNMFYLSIFQEGKTSADANSRNFLLEPQNGNGQSTSSSSSSSSSSTPSPTSSSPTSTSNSSTATNPGANDRTSSPPQSSTSNQALQSQSSNSIPVGTTIGIAIGASGAMALGIGLIFFLYRLRKKRRERRGMTVTVAAPSDPQGYYRDPPGSYQFFGSNMSEAPSKMPMEHMELSELGGTPHGQAQQSNSPVRYEM
ncbi:hypothetical protein DM02DRAFT_654611 [Periconia macrospinosa]|uniref:Mid2 domain-containing protein n=1 Tax=Periconia macrospinosa TaxID=97972 RepID=A0A2V1DSX3_9PLEO|nr:hypothetical protein DM02DRAFT_654611 [Periconia macrospinosa]